MTETKQATDKVKALETQLAKAREETKTAILSNIGEYLKELEALGFQYTLTENGKPAAKQGQKKCSKCGGTGHNSAGCPQTKQAS